MIRWTDIFCGVDRFSCYAMRRTRSGSSRTACCGRPCRLWTGARGLLGQHSSPYPHYSAHAPLPCAPPHHLPPRTYAPRGVACRRFSAPLTHNCLPPLLDMVDVDLRTVWDHVGGAMNGDTVIVLPFRVKHGGAHRASHRRTIPPSSPLRRTFGEGRACMGILCATLRHSCKHLPVLPSAGGFLALGLPLLPPHDAYKHTCAHRFANLASARDCLLPGRASIKQPSPSHPPASALFDSLTCNYDAAAPAA